MAGAGDGVPVLLVTANVGSIFEEPSVMLKIWTEEFLSTVLRLEPKFIALHCQEVGGKNYGQSMNHVEEFVRLLMSSEELRLFDKVRVFLDEDFSSAEHFTALGNLYFVHDSVKEVLIWDFKDCTFVPVDGKEVHFGNIESVATKEKAKFPQDFFPECKWSRKGFLRTRWNISGTVFDLINIHLFHDASNFIAMETFPSVYSKTRRRALEHTLDRFHNDKYSNVPYFLFGDFNFRTDTAGVIKKLTENTQEKIFSNKGSISKLQFRNKDDDLILTLGKKEFSHYDHGNVFIENGGEWLREYDRELENFQGRLFEFPIKFMPSYPLEEDINEATNYMHTRVPAWCDRVLLSPTAKMLVQDIDSPNAVEYGLVGPTTCMGDHKPVYLRAALARNAGTIECCCLPATSMYCFRVPASYAETLPALPGCVSCASARGQCSGVERSSNLLHAIPVKHDPYTPDSMDSPSPNTLAGSAEPPDVQRRDIYAAVPPALLKSRLELIVQSEREQREQQERQREFVHETTDRDRGDEMSLDLRAPTCSSRSRRKSEAPSSNSTFARTTWPGGAKALRRGCRSFDEISDNRDLLSERNLEQVIPKIAIINASNFESNESNVQEDRLDSGGKVRVSDRAILQKVARSSFKGDDQANADRNERLRIESVRSVQDEIDSTGRRDCLGQGAVQESIPPISRLVVTKEKANDSGNVVEDVTRLEEWRNEEEVVDCQESLRRVTPLPEERLTNPQLSLKRSSREQTERKARASSVINVIRPETFTRKLSGNDIEVFASESRQDAIVSKISTRSNSIESQEVGDNAGSLKLKLKAYKVTERYTNNIVGKQGKCHRCCCAVS